MPAPRDTARGAVPVTSSLDLTHASVDDLAALIDETEDPAVLEAIAVALRAEYPWEPQWFQKPPPGDWWAWVMSAGTGCGKTDAGAWWLDVHMTGPPCDARIPGGHKALIAGPTFSDALTTCWQAPAGITTHNAAVRLVGRKDGTHAIWPNGAEALFAGLHDDRDVGLLRSRAANCCTFWVDEAAQTNHLAFAVDLLQQRVRSSKRPHGMITSTPKPTAGWKYLIGLPDVVVTHASSFDNVFLSETHIHRLERFRGTRLERQEIYGELVDDYEGALFSRETLAADRITVGDVLDLEPADRLGALGVIRTATGLDPSTWIPEVGEPADGDEMYTGGAGVETGIVTVGIDRRSPPHVYVLADVSGHLAATEWARRAAHQHHTWGGPIVPETNAGGDTVLATIRLTDSSVPVYRAPGSAKPGVRASTGKRARAEPVGALSEQHRLHMVGVFPALESTLCGWDPTENWSPDRLDALVWAVTALQPWKRRSLARGSTAAGRIIT